VTLVDHNRLKEVFSGKKQWKVREILDHRYDGDHPLVPVGAARCLAENKALALARLC
jgi:hypothetical protein